MSVLTKKEILAKVKTGAIAFDPQLDDFQVQPQSVDIRLGFTFYIVKSTEITKKGRTAINVDYTNNAHSKNYFETIQLNPGQYFEIMPKEYIVGTSFESIHLKDNTVMGMLFPRSSFNRRGLSVDISGVIDSGYTGYLLIPIKNNTNNQTIRLYPGERICQVVFQELVSPIPRDENVVTPHRAQLRKTPKELSITPEQNEEKKYILNGDLDKLKKNFAA